MGCQKTAIPFGLLLLLVQLSDVSWAQRSSAYSLQAALDELHRRGEAGEAAKYPLNAPPSQRFGSALGVGVGVGGEPDYWDEDPEQLPIYMKSPKFRDRHSFKKALAKYLECEGNGGDCSGLSLGLFPGYEFEDDENNKSLPSEEKKRASLFRERDNKYEIPTTSVFRERELQPNPNAGGEPHQAELTEEFLREIEEASEHERKERYKEALRHLWEKYQQQENEVDTSLFEEKKRMRVPPYYMLMQKKRSYPVLPWLPYSGDKKKRFPVAKRSAPRSAMDMAVLGKTDDKVAQELRELFGKPLDEKKKRSTDEQVKTATTTPAPEHATLPAWNNMRIETNEQQKNASQESVKVTTEATGGSGVDHHIGHAGYHGHSASEHKHRKRSDHAHHSHEDSIDASEEDEERDAHEHEGHEHDGHEESNEDSDEDDHDEFDEDDEEGRKKKKKKRDTELKQGTKLENNLMMRSKKSIDWSKYFGLDRKKKSTNPANLNMKKLSPTNTDERKKSELDPEKLENMDKKLQSIEDIIIDETIKYTGAHEGISNQEEIRRLKDHVLSRLATAYSLEKMRRALEKLRQSVENENHLLRNVIEPESDENGVENWSNQKRVAFKKDRADPLENETNGKDKKVGDDTDDDERSDSAFSNHEMKKKKKRNGYLRYTEVPNEMQELATGPGPYESLNDAYLGNKNYVIGSNQCPLIESMAERCRGVDLLSGDINQELLPICGVHQICYLCGTSQIACDYQYLAEADNICGTSNDCQSAARSVLMILRGTPGPQLGPRECLKNPCLYSAMREIGL